MNWSLFLLNELMEDTVLVQEADNPFTYSWFLILIMMVGWMEPTHYQGMEVDVVNICRGTRYKNLWALNDKERKTTNNIQFYLYLDALRDEEIKVLRLTRQAPKKYQRIPLLSMGPHTIHIQVWEDPKKQFLMR